MKPNARDDDQCEQIPENAADAWAEVYIDVAEKLDAEEQQANDVARATNKCDIESAKAKEKTHAQIPDR